MATDTLVKPVRPWPTARILSLPLGLLLALVVLYRLEPVVAGAWLNWLPGLLSGFWVNIKISLLAIALGTLAGIVLGALSTSPWALVRLPTRGYVQLFRNAPWLVLIYFATYVFPFEIALGGIRIAFSDWLKVTLGLALPASANIAEIVRGAIQSIPRTQWEAADSLAFNSRQILRWIILPQCVKRILPPWMNLYAMITMGTALASLVGAHDLLDIAQIASSSVNRSAFTILIYGSVLALFFVYCYPIARLTKRLETLYATR